MARSPTRFSPPYAHIYHGFAATKITARSISWYISLNCACIHIYILATERNAKGLAVDEEGPELPGLGLVEPESEPPVTNSDEGYMSPSTFKVGCLNFSSGGAGR